MVRNTGVQTLAIRTCVRYDVAMELTTVRTGLQEAYAVLSGSRGQGSLAGLTAGLAGLQELRNVIDACQVEALGQLSAIEVTEGEDGTLEEVHHRVGYQAMDAPELVAPCLGISVQAAGHRLGEALSLLTRTPDLAAEMAAGRLDGFRAGVVSGELDDAPVATAAAVVAELIARAEKAGGWLQTAGPLKRSTTAILARIDEAVLAARVTHEKSRRGLSRSVESSGLDRWEGFYPVEDARLAWEAIDVLARELFAAGEADSLIQARADAHMKLLLQQVTATIHLHPTIGVPGADDTAPTADHNADNSEPTPAAAEAAPAADADAAAPAAVRTGSVDELLARVSAAGKEVVGLGGFAGLAFAPVSAAWLAEQVAAGRVRVGELVHCHPALGAAYGFPATIPPATFAGTSKRRQRQRRQEWQQEPQQERGQERAGGTGPRVTAGVGGIEDRYRPSQRLRALVCLRDGTCRFPGCHIPAKACDLDHVQPWPGGATEAGNLIALCRHHHRIKQSPRWRVRLHDNGTVTWWYPDGRTLTTHPIDHLHHGQTLHTSTGRHTAAANTATAVAAANAATAVAAVNAATAAAAAGDDGSGTRAVRKAGWAAPEQPYGIEQHSPLVEHYLRQLLDDGDTPGRAITPEQRARAARRNQAHHDATRHLRMAPTVTVAGYTFSTHHRDEITTPRGHTRPWIKLRWALASYDDPPI